MQKQDGSMWSLSEESNDQFSVELEMWKLGLWQICKIKRANAALATCFFAKDVEGIVDLIEKLCNGVETVNGFCYLGNRLNASGGCEAAVTARVRIGWVRFRECGDLILGNRFPLKIKGKVYRFCVRLAMLYGSEI